MKTLKHIGGIMLATFGMVFVLGSIAAMLSRDSETSGWVIAVMFVGLGLAPLAGAVLLLQGSATELPPVQCPNCGSNEYAPAGVLTKARNFWIWHFGGWLFHTLWGASREQQIRCVQCDALYLTQTRSTRIVGIVLWVFVLLLLLGIIAELWGERS
jgi:hypothetical protein